jgi:hypothetical protein
VITLAECLASLALPRLDGLIFERDLAHRNGDREHAGKITTQRMPTSLRFVMG